MTQIFCHLHAGHGCHALGAAAKGRAVEAGKELAAEGPWGQAALEDSLAVSGIHGDPRYTELGTDLQAEM